jgi:hypothetical protein
MPDKNGFLHRNDGVALKDYVDTRVDSLKELIVSSDKALCSRLEGMNEFRQAMMDQQEKFITKEEYRLAHKPIEDAMIEFREFAARHQGKASTGQLWFVSIISVIGVLLGVLHLFTK